MRMKMLSVEAFTVPHGSFDDAYGFRFTTEDKVIVFSGDTGPSKTLEKFAAGADILVHEVYSNAGFLEKNKRLADISSRASYLHL